METLEETFLYSYVNLMLFSLYDNFIFQLTNSPTLKNILSPDKPQLLYQFYRSLWKLDPDYYCSFPPDDIRHDYLRQHQFRPRDSQGVHEDLVDNFHDEAFIMNITKYYYTYGKELKHANKSLPFIRGVHPMNLDDEDDISQRWFESLVTSENDESDNDNATNKLTNAVVYTEDNRGRQLFTSDQNHDTNTSSDSSCSLDYPIADLDSETESNNFEVDAKLSHDGLFATTQKRILFLEDDDVLLFDKLDPPLYAFCDVRGISVDVLTRNITSSSKM
ncbi:uncharacterized protein KQ657_001349 [Scheffersomyces spartinae]|uniref:Uncharacterized protein n=1 Tax=Scheffersomyces spartinae TaxID=45513 RepID=A0A9P7V7Z9_9ASCO|nr:uncharacterized protein KQ657_001349 [Scheffersomyces spartinae]KAG7192892.1 hypothetical protein KQ657_001349 [Scheffersomyces spartinae]